jgi:HEAT repeat protein
MAYGVVFLFNPSSDDYRVAHVMVVPAPSDPSRFVVRTSRGAESSFLHDITITSPLTADQVEATVASVVVALRADGYLPAGMHADLEALTDERSAVRAHAAQRLGWRRDPAALEPLLEALAQATDDTCAILDALGMIGDPRAIPAVRAFATRKLLSRRRSAMEALRNLGDHDGINQARLQLLPQLPAGVRAVATLTGDTPAFTAALNELPAHERGLAIDVLYETPSPRAVAAIRAFLADSTFTQAYLWRYIKSIFKRAMLRHDYEMFGWLQHQIEIQGSDSRGATALVKSGLDGQQRTTRIFSRRTQAFLRGASWHWLEHIARRRPESYPAAAVEAIVPYSNEDESAGGSYSRHYLLYQILLGRSPQLRFSPRTRIVWDAANLGVLVSGRRDEPFPEVWDAHPRAYLRLLAAARLPLAHEFALRAIADRHPNLLQQATPVELLGMLGAPHGPTVRLALAELNRRFDPARPDWALLESALGATFAEARAIGLAWLERSAATWSGDGERILRLLQLPDLDTRYSAARLVVAHIGAAARPVVAAGVLATLRQPEPIEGAHDAAALVAREAVAAELAEILTFVDLMQMLVRGSTATQTVAGAVLAVKPGAAAELGAERVAALALHDLAAVRAAGHSLIRANIELWRQDPSLLFALAECDWADTRNCVLELMRASIDVVRLGLDGFVGLLDSNFPDVQDHARDLILRHLDELPVVDLVERAVQHPHVNVRRFAVDLMIRFLPDDAEALASVATFCRSVLFDLWPSRALKRRVLDFVTERGLRDPRQAAVAVELLGNVVRLRGRADFERAIEGLARLRLTYPAVGSVVTLSTRDESG